MNENEKAKVLELREDSIERLKTDPIWIDRGAQILMTAQLARRMNDTPLAEFNYDIQVLLTITLLVTQDLDDPATIDKSDIAATFAANWEFIVELANTLQDVWIRYIDSHSGDCATCEDADECGNSLEEPKVTLH